MKQITRRLIPVDPLDIAAMESWLADMAGDGLFLLSFGSIFAKFEAGAPRKAAYRLEATPAPLIDPDVKKRELLEEFGWEYVCPAGKYFHVYRAKTEDAPEIHTDPAVQAEAFGKIYHSQRNWAIPYCIIYIILLAFLLFEKKPGFFNLVLKGGLAAIFSLYMVVFAILGIRHILRLRRIKSLLENGAPLSHSGEYRKKQRRHLLASALVLLLFSFYLLLDLSLIFVAWDADWRELSTPIPMVSLAEIEQDPDFRNGHIDDASTTYIGGDPDNEIRFDRSFLAPLQFTVTQSGYVPGREWADGSGETYAPTLLASLYRLRYPSMGARFVESKLEWELAGIMEWDTQDLSAGTGLDEAWLCTPAKFSSAPQKLFLRQGDMVLFAEYRGEKDLRDFLPEFAALMREAYPTKKPR